MQGKRILITGGLGFIFSHVSEFLFNRGNAITVVDNLSAGSNPEILGQKPWNEIELLRCDVNDIQNIQQQFDIIIHAAAESNVDKSIRSQADFIQTNVNGTWSVLEFARSQTNLEKLLYINTDEVYGSSEDWCSTDSRLSPRNPYAATKAAAGHLCWSYFATFGLPVCEVRMCNVIGRRQSTTKLLPRLLSCALSGAEFPLYDGGCQTREYIDVRDVVKIIEMVLQYPINEIYNITLNQEYSTRDVIEITEKVTGKSIRLIDATRLGHDNRYRMQPHALMFNEVNHRISHHSLTQTIEWVWSGMQF